jgi:hypothetical protein
MFQSLWNPSMFQTLSFPLHCNLSSSTYVKITHLPALINTLSSHHLISFIFQITMSRLPLTKKPAISFSHASLSTANEIKKLTFVCSQKVKFWPHGQQNYDPVHSYIKISSSRVCMFSSFLMIILLSYHSSGFHILFHLLINKVSSVLKTSRFLVISYIQAREKNQTKRQNGRKIKRWEL